MLKLIGKAVITAWLLTSANVYAASCASLADLDWLLGHWQTHNQQPATKEHWTKLSEDTFAGTGVTSNKHESLRLLAMSGELFYLAKVAHNPMPIAFKLNQCQQTSQGQSFSFENPAHDFPHTIKYQLHNDNSVTITVSGKSEKAFTIQLYRVKNSAINN
ncbi:hypothetical protein SAMN05216262_103169 [Colwellia chukchiensis]|uniref:DUF6265 domain-containing protein n=1 Tax=Colwellia chukchiensis TaxID=641665 RepID=A0A1H7KJS5_9GAMM|nr:DUF6265 family protein [Colwellia chukchiensis]SEK87038.1 hypothetical protein SAMN05216262_103169 [Colwellia chukchiensis]